MPGWPRKDEEMRLYRDKDGSFMLLLLDDRQGGNYGAVCNALAGPEPSLCYSGVSVGYIAQNWLKRFQWGDLPAEWQAAFTRYMHDPDEDPPFDPARVRGFWRVGNQPQPA